MTLIEKNEKWFVLGVRWRKHSWTRDHRSALAFAPKISAITTRQVSFVDVVMTITTIIIYYHQSINLILKSFFPSNFIKSRIRSSVLWSPRQGDINVKLLQQHCLKIQGATYADCDGVYMVTDSSVERTNDTFVLYFGWMKKKSQIFPQILAFHNMFFCL